MASTRIRLRFAKCGDLRLVSHHDLMRCLERSLRRCGLPVATTQGFTPRPRAVFAQALALGIEGRREVLELDLEESLEPGEVLERLGAVLPEGFDLLEAEAVPVGRAARPVSARYELEVPPEERSRAGAALAMFLGSESVPYTRRRGEKVTEYDLRALVRDAGLDESGRLTFVLAINPSGSARPEEYLESLGLRDLLERGATLIRADLELACETGAPDVGAPVTTESEASAEEDDAHAYETKIDPEPSCPAG
jgi:radical SAM-linked protein